MPAASLQDTCGGAGVGTVTDFSVGGGRVGSQRLCLVGEGKAPMGLDLSLGAGPQGLSSPLTHRVTPNCPSLSLSFSTRKMGLTSDLL